MQQGCIYEEVLHFQSFHAFPKTSKLKKKLSGNHGGSICRLFHVLVQFFFTTSKSELHYYHQRVNVQVASRVLERRKTQDLRKLRNFKKISEKLGTDSKSSVGYPKAKLWQVRQKIQKETVVKHSKEIPILLNFENLSTMFYQ